MAVSGRTDYVGRTIEYCPEVVVPIMSLPAKYSLRSDLNTLETLLTIESFRTFTRLIEGTEIERTLESQSGFTLFAPMNRGFINLPGQFLDKLISARNTRILLEVLKYHLVAGEFRASELPASQFITTEQGHDLKVSDNGALRINHANIVLPDIETTDGIIHGIDELLIPGEIALVKYLSLSRRIYLATDEHR